MADVLGESGVITRDNLVYVLGETGVVPRKLGRCVSGVRSGHPNQPWDGVSFTLEAADHGPNRNPEIYGE